MPYTNIKKYQEYQREWRKKHPDYYKEYYRKLKDNKKSKFSLLEIIKKVFKGGKK